MMYVGVFPFGRPITTLRQVKRDPWHIFVLGVYASAVHAHWIGADGKAWNRLDKPKTTSRRKHSGEDCCLPGRLTSAGRCWM